LLKADWWYNGVKLAIKKLLVQLPVKSLSSGYYLDGWRAEPSQYTANNQNQLSLPSLQGR